mgnify:CR=1 FL=1
MFKFLKEKIFSALKVFKKRAPVEKIEKEAKPKKEKPVEKVKKEAKEAKPKKEIEKEIKPKKEKGLIKKIKEAIFTIKLSKEKFLELFWNLELALLESNVALEAIEKIKKDLEEELVEKRIDRKLLLEKIKERLKSAIEELILAPFEIEDLIKKAEVKPYVICFFGINGSGKTTTIAKIANHLKKLGYSIVLAASDTWRAAAIEQLDKFGSIIEAKVIKHAYGSDPAAVAFDAINHAKAAGKDIVLIDTAGRMHSNINLMSEMQKIVRVAKPNLKIFVGEAIAGNDIINQAKEFDNAVGIDGIILTKADLDEKGGAIISLSYAVGKPIIMLGTGQSLEDLETFSKKRIIEKLL